MEDETPFPDKLAPEIRPLFKELKEHLVPLTKTLLEGISLSLGLDRFYFSNLHRHILEEGNRSDMRTLYYPPIKGERSRLDS